MNNRNTTRFLSIVCAVVFFGASSYAAHFAYDPSSPLMQQQLRPDTRDSGYQHVLDMMCFGTGNTVGMINGLRTECDAGSPYLQTASVKIAHLLSLPDNAGMPLSPQWWDFFHLHAAHIDRFLEQEQVFDPNQLAGWLLNLKTHREFWSTYHERFAQQLPYAHELTASPEGHFQPLLLDDRSSHWHEARSFAYQQPENSFITPQQTQNLPPRPESLLSWSSQSQTSDRQHQDVQPYVRGTHFERLMYEIIDAAHESAGTPIGITYASQPPAAIKEMVFILGKQEARISQSTLRQLQDPYKGQFILQSLRMYYQQGGVGIAIYLENGTRLTPEDEESAALCRVIHIGQMVSSPSTVAGSTLNFAGAQSAYSTPYSQNSYGQTGYALVPSSTQSHTPHAQHQYPALPPIPDSGSYSQALIPAR